MAYMPSLTICRMSSCFGTTIKLRLSRKRWIRLTTSAYDLPLTDSPLTLMIRSPEKERKKNKNKVQEIFSSKHTSKTTDDLRRRSPDGGQKILDK